MEYQPDRRPDGAGAVEMIEPDVRNRDFSSPETTDPEDPAEKEVLTDAEVDKQMAQVRHLADLGQWHGVHVALTWYRRDFVACGRADAAALLERMDEEVGKAKLRDPHGGWGNYPEGRLLWSRPLDSGHP